AESAVADPDPAVPGTARTGTDPAVPGPAGADAADPRAAAAELVRDVGRRAAGGVSADRRSAIRRTGPCGPAGQAGAVAAAGTGARAGDGALVAHGDADDHRHRGCAGAHPSGLRLRDHRHGP